MSKTILLAAAGIAISAAMLGAGYLAARPAPAAAVASATPTPAPSTDRGAVETIVREYLIANPEVMLEVQAAYEAKQQTEQKAAQEQTISSESADIFNADYDGVVGNPAGKVTIVEFYDYNCGYCKRAMQDMDAMVESDKDLRFVLKEFPILGADSQKAHVVSMAFRTLKPESYGAFHRELLAGEARATEERAMDIALGLGVDEAALREEMKNPKITEAFAKTFQLADKLAITGTPSYVLGDEVVFGALGQQVLSEKVANLKACDSTTC